MSYAIGLMFYLYDNEHPNIYAVFCFKLCLVKCTFKSNESLKTKL